MNFIKLNYIKIYFILNFFIVVKYYIVGCEYDGLGILRKWWFNGVIFNFIEKIECMSN